MKKRIIQVILIILLILVFYFRIKNAKNKPIKETRLALGTFVTIDIRDKNSDNKSIIDSCYNIIKKYEKIFSHTIPNSELNNINNSSEDAIIISQPMSELIKISKEISTVSNGAFDVTVGIVLDNYDFANSTFIDSTKIKNEIEHINFRNIKVEKNTLVKLDKDVILDFGGIAKGYIVDKVVEYLYSKNIKYATINAGGDLYVMKNPDKERWEIGIIHPRKKDTLFAQIEMKNKAIVTSGDYEQFFMLDGRRIHHIIDPRTGYPANKSIGTTVVANNVCFADGLCTAIFVLGPDKGIELANNINNVEALVIYGKDNKLKFRKSTNFDNYDFFLNCKAEE